MARNVGEVFVTLHYDIATAALAVIRDATLVWENKPEAMAELLRQINFTAQTALKQVQASSPDTPIVVKARGE